MHVFSGVCIYVCNACTVYICVCMYVLYVCMYVCMCLLWLALSPTVFASVIRSFNASLFSSRDEFNPQRSRNHSKLAERTYVCMYVCMYECMYIVNKCIHVCM